MVAAARTHKSGLCPDRDYIGAFAKTIDYKRVDDCPCIALFSTGPGRGSAEKSSGCLTRVLCTDYVHFASVRMLASALLVHSDWARPPGRTLPKAMVNGEIPSSPQA